MKVIGLIGGMSWESSVPYYRQINEVVRERLGGLHSAKVILFSVNFHEIEQLQRAGDWDAAGARMAVAAKSLVAAGAEMLVLCTNTMHQVAPAIEAAVSIPFLHIADPTGDAIQQAGMGTVGLLGTRFTMERDFYKERLHQKHGLAVIVPQAAQRELVHRVIYEELCLGKIEPASRKLYRAVMADLVAQGAQAIILGCTEISLLINADDAAVPLFDTTSIHARRAALLALGE